MRVILLSKTKKPSCLFSSPFEWFSSQEMQGILNEATDSELFYIDFSSFAKRDIPGILENLASNRHIHWAAIDSNNYIKDIAFFFHSGASDYIGANMPDGIITEERLDNVFQYSNRCKHEQLKRRGRNNHAAFPGWGNLKTGKSYNLLMLYVGIPEAEDLHSRLGSKGFARLKTSVQNLLSGIAQETGGMLWISDDQSFIMLFEPNALNKVCEICIRILANMHIVSFEHFRLAQDLVQLNFCILQSEIPWQKPGNTGSLVSEQVNYIFHLGRRFTPPGCIDFVDDVAERLPSRITERLQTGGVFENRQTSRFTGFINISLFQ